MTESSNQTSPSGETSALDWEDPSVLPVEEVRDVFVTLTKALRAYQLYDPGNPVYKRFVANLREAFAGIWESRGRLEILVDESRLTWMGDVVYSNANRSESLAFVFYRDGIRELTFSKGLEGGELERLLDALHRAKNVRGEGDDLVTILWDLDLKHLSYGAVDVLGDGIDLPGPSEAQAFDPRAILAGLDLVPPGVEEDSGPEGDDDEDDDGEEEAGQAGGSRPASKTVAKEDFNPTLYALDPAEREYLARELRKEMERDLRAGVLNGLLDRLEEPAREVRQEEILGVLRTLLPNFLSQGALTPAAMVVQELDAIRRRDGILNERAQELADGILDDLSSAESVTEIVRSIEDGTFPPDATELRALLRFLRAEALSPLLQGAENASSKDAQRLLRQAIHGIAEANRSAVVGLLDSPDSSVLIGAIRMIGQLELVDAAASLVRLLDHPHPEVRRTVVEVAELIPSSILAGGLQRVLQDPDWSLSLSAARALGATKYAPAAAALRDMVERKDVRSAEIGDKLPYFEAYAQVAGDASIPYLDRILNGKGFLGRRESSDLRACAALGLGKVGSPAATGALERARGEDDPVVRSAVNRALRGEDGKNE